MDPHHDPRNRAFRVDNPLAAEHWVGQFRARHCGGHLFDVEAPVQIPAAFDYVRASTVDDEFTLLDRHGPESRVVAGGHSLLPMMKLRLARPDWLIDINDLFELDFVFATAAR